MIRRPPRSTRTDTLFPYTTLFRSLDVQRVLGWAGIGIGGEVEVENGEVVGQRYPLKSVPFDANTIGPILIEPAQIKATGMIGGTLAPEHVRLDQHYVKPRPPGDVARAFRRKPGWGMSSAERRVGKECVSTGRSRG